MAATNPGYQSFMPFNEDAETSQESGVMIHVVPESGRSRWNHIEDLDSFFTRVYHYHQKHGFSCMMLQEVLELFQFIFVVLFSTFLLQCVDYSVLFKDKPIGNVTDGRKVNLNDAVVPIGQCVRGLSPTLVICLLVALVFWLLRLVKVVYHCFQYLEIRAFYSTALKVSSSDLDNMTWHEVQQRLLEVQREQQMCIHKRELTDLDIYHRILRFKNYMVAMVNKDLLPLRYSPPFIGDVIFLTNGLKYNLEIVLFWGPWAPFDNNWHLKEDYKIASKRKLLANELSKHILWIGIANFLLCPLILLWQVLYSFFHYAEILKREPGALGARRWSMYARLYLRHFNELDHELNARFSRGYKVANQYMGIFSSHIMSIVAKNVAFFAGSVLAVLVGLTVYDEDVLTVEHVLTTITILGFALAGCRVFIPDEHLVWCPEKLMMNILAHIHYIPDDWKGHAHTYKVRNAFAQLFQYKAAYLIEELLSPIITPIILCFYLRHRSLDIVDFYRNFTVDVAGVGDVCSFAQMDVKKHGNSDWLSEPDEGVPSTQKAENGKTELSLMHFTLTNPTWTPPDHANQFLTSLRAQARQDADHLGYTDTDNPLYSSLHSLSSMSAGYANLMFSIQRSNFDHRPAPTVTNNDRREPTSLITSSLGRSVNQNVSSSPWGSGGVVTGGISQTEGPLNNNSAGLLTSLQPSYNHDRELYSSHFMDNTRPDAPVEFTAANMSLSTLYMHQLHDLHRRSPATSVLNSIDRSQTIDPRVQQQAIWQRPSRNMPGIVESPFEMEEREDRNHEHQPLLRDKK